MEFQEVIEFDDCQKTDDVKSKASFERLMISSTVVDSLRNNGFKNPSPVQEKAIPAGLIGLDILVQAKSGTGKTLVFSVMAVENLKTHTLQPQRLIITPTREIATQIKETIRKISPPRTKILVLVGGNPVKGDIQLLSKGAHIIIGTTGRLCQLVQNNHLSLSHCELFVLDEADKLMDADFQKDINYLFSSLPPSRQVAVFSATYPRQLDRTLSKFMRDVTLIRLNSGEIQLIGIKQYVYIRYHNSDECVVDLLHSINFKQAIVFCNTQITCELLQRVLEQNGISCAYISAQLEQSVRDRTIDLMKQNKIKVLVSTDLTARGIDVNDVNLVVNIEPAVDCETYFHRIGRAARFGGYGAAVTLLTTSKALTAFTKLVGEGGIVVRRLELDTIPSDLTVNEEHFELSPIFEISDKSNHLRPSVREQRLSQPVLDGYSSQSHADQPGRSYSREELYSLRGLGILSPELMKTINTFGINSNDFRQCLGDYIAFRETAKADKDGVEEKIPAAKKYKFVPSRNKTTKKFYMRGELLSVRNSMDESAWRKYASSKWNLEEEPFVQMNTQVATTSSQSLEGNTNFNNEVGTKVTPSAAQKAVDDSKLAEKSAVQYKYSRKQMINIQNNIPKQSWLTYVKAKWDTTEEPFQLDAFLRCPFEDQLRRTRLREKQLRDKVLAERKAALTKSTKLIASSRSISRSYVTNDSFLDFCCDLQKQFNDFNEEAEINKGPIVPLRDSSDVWRYRIDFYQHDIETNRLQFQYNVKTSGKMISEQHSQTIEQPSTSSSTIETKIVEEHEILSCEVEGENDVIHAPDRDVSGMGVVSDLSSDNNQPANTTRSYSVLDTYLSLASRYYE